MKGYTEIRPGMAEKGDIVKIVSSAWNDSIKAGNWKENFSPVIRYLRLLEMPSNNGNVKAGDFTGKGFKWLNLNTDKSISGIYRKV